MFQPALQLLIHGLHCAGEDGPAILLVHGFGANADHFRNNIDELAETGKVWVGRCGCGCGWVWVWVWVDG